MKEIKETLEEMGKQIDGILTVSLVSADGLIVSEYTPDPNAMDAELAAANLSTVMRRVISTVEDAKLGRMVDNLLSTENGHFLTKLIGDGSVFLVIAAKRGANLGAMRYISKVYSTRLWEMLPH